MGEILIPRRTKVEKGYELLADITVGTATTSVDITGLNIGKGDEVVLVSDVLNNTATGALIYTYFNGNNTATNYYAQQLRGNGTSVTSARSNDARIFYVENSGKGTSICNVKLTNSGCAICQSFAIDKYGTSSVELWGMYNNSMFTMSSIMSIRLSSNQSNGIGIGSRFQLYKIN